MVRDKDDFEEDFNCKSFKVEEDDRDKLKDMDDVFDSKARSKRGLTITGKIFVITFAILFLGCLVYFTLDHVYADAIVRCDNETGLPTGDENIEYHAGKINVGNYLLYKGSQVEIADSPLYDYPIVMHGTDDSFYAGAKYYHEVCNPALAEGFSFEW